MVIVMTVTITTLITIMMAILNRRTSLSHTFRLTPSTNTMILGILFNKYRPCCTFTSPIHASPLMININIKQSYPLIIYQIHKLSYYSTLIRGYHNVL